MLPIARWIGYGGETDFHGSVLETLIWATGLLANTKHINVFATVHTAFIHPLVAAKQLATADQLSHGRLGLNVVAGWNKPEYDAFGIDLRSSTPIVTPWLRSGSISSPESGITMALSIGTANI